MRDYAIGIVCSDVEASLVFFQQLGVPFEDYHPDEGHYEAQITERVRLMLDSEAVMASFIEGYTPPTGNDRVTLAIGLDDPMEVDATYDTMMEAGYDSIKEPFDAVWGQRYATIADPDGNHVDLYAQL